MLRILNSEDEAYFPRGFDAINARGGVDAFEPPVVARQKTVVAGKELERLKIRIRTACADGNMEDVNV